MLGTSGPDHTLKGYSPVSLCGSLGKLEPCLELRKTNLPESSSITDDPIINALWELDYRLTNTDDKAGVHYLAPTAAVPVLWM